MPKLEKNPNRPNDKYDYTADRRNKSRNERRKWFTERFGMGVDKFISSAMKATDEELEQIEQIIKKYAD